MSSFDARVLEPEVMDTEVEALDYDAMDHVDVNASFCVDLLAHGPLASPVLDVGTGTALIPIELCRREPSARIVAIDLARHMLALAESNVVRAAFSDRIVLEVSDAKSLRYEDDAFATAISNSVVHHSPAPDRLLTEIARVTKRGGLVFVRDLVRPRSRAESDALVERYAGTPPEAVDARAAFERQRELFRASLAAALSLDEIRDIAVGLDWPASCVSMTSDRHWTLAARTAA